VGRLWFVKKNESRRSNRCPEQKPDSLEKEQQSSAFALSKEASAKNCCFKRFSLGKNRV
jgi:hypothetical protein